jgi:opacity protein-like surface antigen
MLSKKYLFTILFTGLTIAGFAQNAPSFIEVGGGVSFPTGNWSKTSTASSLMSIEGTINDPHGYAKPGGFGFAEGGWFFSKHFGVGLMFRTGTYNLKGLDSLSQGYEESFDVDTTKTHATHYTMWSITPALYYYTALSKRFAFTAKAMVGIVHASTPQFTVNIIDGGVPDPPVVQESASATALAFGLGAGLRYQVYKCLALDLKADYLYSKPDFTITNEGRNNNAGREVSSYNQPMAPVSVSLGIAYLFKHK